MEIFRKSDRDIVVGIDFSGDARCGDLADFLPILKKAQDEDGAKLAVHLGEVPNHDEVEKCLSVIRPDRVGHGTHIHPQTEGGTPLAWKLMAKTPVEICLSSNLWCQSVPDLKSHHINLLHTSGHPFVLCTDDKGAFDCTLSEEYAKAQQVLELNDQQMFRLSFRSIDAIFSGQDVEEKLKLEWNKWWDNWQMKP